MSYIFTVGQNKVQMWKERQARVNMRYHSELTVFTYKYWYIDMHICEFVYTYTHFLTVL